MARFGGAPGDWLDLSTGINPRPYPLPAFQGSDWAALPSAAALDALEETARAAYGCPGAAVALAGAQAAIQLVPWLRPPGRARVLAPTYNEHAAALRAAGWEVSEVSSLSDLAGADLAVVVNPNNPDGRAFAPDDLLALRRAVGLLVVDESFADPTPEISLGRWVDGGTEDLLLLRSFGKFYGLAGLRLGFALCGADMANRLRERAGPWSVNGPALRAGQAALADRAWEAETTARLLRDAGRLDRLAEAAGWRGVGGTALFRTYETGGAQAAQDRLAAAHIWSRIFPYSPSWIRLGLPGDAAGWARLEAALAGR
ncbi:L-threonine O-3-phosphate decarboxylase [Poseidonocella sedimentorum]|uniref:threonine-phosphate decarboxylase n=2 Tax=Poseidonocella sedimentorum TaxID=871652 RepID=A0A1I6EK08_9RHOB|nr:L-threonine O-3-phosphate decarboxylase [Poseidonocella sedimentorum]